MPLGEKTRIFFDFLRAETESRPQKLFKDYTLSEIREGAYSPDGLRKYTTPLPPGVISEDFVCQILYLKSGCSLPIQIYTPPAVESYAQAPTALYFHGGGFCLNLNPYQKAPCATIARLAQCRVIMIEYPNTPESSAELVVNTCYEVTAYLYKNSDFFKIDRDNFILVGYSSGATIAALLTNRSLTDKSFKVSQQILVSPLVDLSLETHKSNIYCEFQKEDLLLPDDVLEYFANTFVQNADPKSPDISPLFQTNFFGLPETLIIVGEYDALRADGTVYAQHIKSFGQLVDLIVCEGQTHNFMAYRLALNDGIDPAELAAQSILKKLQKKVHNLTMESKLKASVFKTFTTEGESKTNTEDIKSSSII